MSGPASRHLNNSASRAALGPQYPLRFTDAPLNKSGSELSLNTFASPATAVVAASRTTSTVATPRDNSNLYCWGSNESGQLAADPQTVKDVQATPVTGNIFPPGRLSLVASGRRKFNAALTKTGECYLWGGSSVDSWMPWALPLPVSLRATTVFAVACGAEHVAMLVEGGYLCTMGAGAAGQLGLGVDVTSCPAPRLVPTLSEHSMVAVACGDNFTLALTSTGDVWGFGENAAGALGNCSTANATEPTRMLVPEGFPIAGMACGAQHTILWDVDGGLLGCGLNSSGQLGLGSTRLEAQLVPVTIDSLARSTVVQVVCGANFSAVRTSSGRVFTMGANNRGQLGLGNTIDAYVGSEVTSLRGMRVVQLAAGAEFVLAVAGRGELYGWGAHNAGVLGDATTDVLAPNLLTLLADKAITSLSCGGQSVLALVRPKETADAAVSIFDAMSPKSWSPSALSPAHLLALAAERGQDATSASLARAPIEYLDALRLADLLEVGRLNHGDYSQLITTIEVVFSSPASLNASFLLPSNRMTRRGSGIDLVGLQQFYHVTQTLLPSVGAALNAAILQLIVSMEAPSDAMPHSALRVYHILLMGLGPAVNNLGVYRPALHAVAEAFHNVHPRIEELFVQWFAEYPTEIFKRLVHLMRLYIDAYLTNGWNNFDDFENVVRLMGHFFESNKLNKRLPCAEFYSDAVNRTVNLLRDYDMWKGDIIRSESTLPNDFSFCAYPFLINAAHKTSILHHEAAMYRFHEYGQAVLANVFAAGGQRPNLRLAVRRDHLIEDTIDQMIEHKADYRKPLKIEFIGEPGQDEGGLRKEFFQLLTRQIFAVDYGMFLYDSETHTYNFDPQSLASPGEFQLIGTLLGLAIYNGVILNIKLPRVIYARLMGMTPTLDDFKETYPTAGRSLQQLLDFDGDVENTFCLTFSVSSNYYGEMRTYELVEGGAGVPVTRENRRRYVELYVKYVLEDSIMEQMTAFRYGFYMVCGTAAFRLLTPEELELAICGSPVIDFNELQQFTEYVGEYSKEHPNIKLFWEVVMQFNEEEKGKLLKFTTGTDRIPMGGFKLVRFTIERPTGGKNAPDRLPTSHTCFNVLVLPEYRSTEEMRARLTTAINYAEGFGKV